MVKLLSGLGRPPPTDYNPRKDHVRCILDEWDKNIWGYLHGWLNTVPGAQGSQAFDTFKQLKLGNTTGPSRSGTLAAARVLKRPGDPIPPKHLSPPLAARDVEQGPE